MDFAYLLQRCPAQRLNGIYSSLLAVAEIENVGLKRGERFMVPHQTLLHQALKPVESTLRLEALRVEKRTTIVGIVEISRVRSSHLPVSEEQSEFFERSRERKKTIKASNAKYSGAPLVHGLGDLLCQTHASSSTFRL
ncbi:hypothetical protein BWI17_13590 [Betaproteobacteria bacterium GR16-43]|nr:hypothetical protein BWI17_13590 [Betaproteobacteria bacterium GR16-43]